MVGKQGGGRREEQDEGEEEKEEVSGLADENENPPTEAVVGKFATGGSRAACRPPVGSLNVRIRRGKARIQNEVRYVGKVGKER